ncbi:hypothetical protein SVIOM342S_00266 [Streptomyces violaceorubidus]
MARGAARGYIDVASVKGGPRRELEARGLDLSAYIGTDPMSGLGEVRPRWPPPPTSSRAVPGRFDPDPGHRHRGC